MVSVGSRLQHRVPPVVDNNTPLSSPNRNDFFQNEESRERTVTEANQGDVILSLIIKIIIN